MYNVVILALVSCFGQGLSISVHQEATMNVPSANEQPPTRKMFLQNEQETFSTVIVEDMGAEHDALGSVDASDLILREANQHNSSNQGECTIGQKNGPFTCAGQACVNLGYVIRHACQACGQSTNPETGNKWLSPEKESQCRKSAQGGQTEQGVEVHCSSNWNRNNGGCVYPVVGASGWTDFGNGGTQLICPCVSKYVQLCQNKGLGCILDKVDGCPNLCAGIKSRIKQAAAQSSSLIDAQGKDKLQEQLHVDIDSHGKLIQNTSAPLMSLDHSLVARSMSQKQDGSDDARLEHTLTDKCGG